MKARSRPQVAVHRVGMRADGALDLEIGRGPEFQRRRPPPSTRPDAENISRLCMFLRTRIQARHKSGGLAKRTPAPAAVQAEWPKLFKMAEFIGIAQAARGGRQDREPANSSASHNSLDCAIDSPNRTALRPCPRSTFSRSPSRLPSGQTPAAIRPQQPPSLAIHPSRPTLQFTARRASRYSTCSIGTPHACAGPIGWSNCSTHSPC